MGEIKTKPTKASVQEYIASIADEKKRADAKRLLKIFKEATGMKPVMWGNSMVGYGMYHYKSERSTQQGDWPLTAFSARVQSLTVYVMMGFPSIQPLLKKLGKHTASKGACLYIKRLSDIDVKTLTAIIKANVAEMKKRYPEAKKT